MKRVIFSSIIFGIVITSMMLIGFGQTASQSPNQKVSSRVSSISGRVVNDSGSPVPNVRVLINGFARQGARRTINTDEDGRFVADDLPRGNYVISVQANGYVSARSPNNSVYYRPGDTVNLVLKKGAVITGTVTTAEGEPVVLVPITAIMVRDEYGRRSGNVYGFPRYTDDRGIYRLFGLPAGTYIIGAASKNFRTSLTPFEDHTTTYYPSSTRDTAAEVVAQYGAEATGIDIRYRGEVGHAVSGTLIDRSAPDSVSNGLIVQLYRTSNDTFEAQTSTRPRGGETGFSIFGVPDSDYYLTARRLPSQSDDGAGSKRIPVRVKGQDVTGIAISLTPLGSLAGRLTLDLATKDRRCESKLTPAVEEALISISSEDSDNDDPSSRYSSSLFTPDNRGDFVFQALPAARYRIDSRMVLDESWYMHALTVPGPTGTPVDASASGFVVRPGQRTSGVRVVLGEGAASIRGRVRPENEGASLPDKLRVYLVPSEPSSADEMLRYIEAEVQSDGSFKLLNVAPGKYWLLAQPLSEDDLKARVPRPQSWKSSNRAALRREATAANVSFELKPCQRVSDFQLRYSPPKEDIRPKRQ